MLGLRALQQDEQILGVLCRQPESGQPRDQRGLASEDGGSISNVSHDHLKFDLTGAHSGRVAVFQHPHTLHQTCPNWAAGGRNVCAIQRHHLISSEPRKTSP